MTRSESIKEIAAAMNKAQAEMTAAKKDAKNPFFKSKYADLGSVILALKEAFANNGLSFMQSPFMTDGGVGVETLIMHSSGEWLEGELTLPLDKPTPQAAGSAITYARRYALQSMAGIPSADDDAEFTMARNKKPEPVISDEQYEKLIEACVDADVLTEDICKIARIKYLKELQASKFDKVIAYLEKKDPKNEK